MKRLFHGLVSVLVVVQMVLYPVYSYAAPLNVDTSVTNRPSITYTGNGRPVVNIVAPSASGTSHNKFTDYNVDANGVILNNGVNDSASLKNGTIRRNPHFVGSPAQVILNEVTGVSPSRLEGETEVVGSSASVIVANPNGVACDGCSFQNTPRVTLTTGVPDSSNGNVNLDVSRGKVSVEGAGLRQGGIGQVDLVGRRVVLDGAVQLGSDANLNIIAGTNGYDHASGKVTAKNGTAPALGAIDASELGAMEAGRISVMSTTAGAGVRVDGNMASTAGNITIDAAGNIQMGADRAAGVAYAPQSVTSKNNLTIRTTGELNKNSNSYSYRNTKIEAGRVKNTGRVDADNDLAVGVSSHYENSGKLDAARDMTLDLQGTTHNSGIVDAGRDLVVHTGGEFVNDNIKITAGNKITMDGTGNVVNRDTDMYAAGGIDINVPNLQHRGVSYLGSDGTVSITAGNAIENLDHDSVIQATGALSLVAGGLIDNRFGQILGGSDILLRAPTIINQNGLIAATGESGNIIIEASSLFDNRGGILSSVNDISINAGLLDNNEGQITAGGGLFATLGGLQNTDGVILADGSVVLNATGLLSNVQGTIASLGADVTMEAQDIDTSYGAIIGKTALTLTTLPGGTLTATGAYLQTDGTLALTSGGDLSLAESNLLAGMLNLSAVGDLYAPYSILAGTDGVTLDAGGLLTLAGDGTTGLVVSNGDIAVNAGDMDSFGTTLQTGTSLAVDVVGDMHGEQSVFAAHDGRVSTGGLLENTYASFLSDTGLLLESAGDMKIDGSQLLANDDITVSAGGALSANDIQSGFVMDADGNITVVSELFTLSGASVEAARAAVMGNLDVSLNALSGDMASVDSILFSNTGIVLDSAGRADVSGANVTAPEKLEINAGGDVSVSDAALVSNADITIGSGGTFINTGANGYVLTGGETTKVTIDAQAFNSTSGAILANDGITLTSDGDMLLGSVLYSNTDLHLTTQTGDIINQGGDVTVVGSLLVNTGGNVYNSGTVIVQEGFDLSIGGMFDNSGGTVSTIDDVNITASSIINNGGNIASGGLVILNGANGISNIGGNIFATTTLNANTSGSFANDNGVVQSLSDMYLQATGGFSNLGGTVATNGRLQLNVSGGSIENFQDGLVQSAGDLTITAAHIRNGDSGTHGSILSGGDISVDILNNAAFPNNFGNGSGGYVEAAGSIRVTSAGRVGNAGGTYIAGDDIIINAQSEVRNYNGGVMQAGDTLSITTAGGVSNFDGGSLYGANSVTINATSQSFVLLDPGNPWNGQPYSTLNNSNGGSITSNGFITLNLRDLYNEGGEIISNGNLNINVSNNGSQVSWSTNNNGGVIHSNSNLSLTTTGGLYSAGGEISAVGNVNMYAAGEIDNSAGGLIRGGGAVGIRNYAGNLWNGNGGRIESSSSVAIDLGEHVLNPVYINWQSQVAAYNACLLNPACTPGAAPGAAPVQYIRGDVYNGAGVITAPSVSILAHAVINDPIFGQGIGGATLSTNQLILLMGGGMASGSVDSASARQFDTVALQQSGDQTVGGPSMGDISTYINSLPGAGQLTDEQIAYLMANYGYLARQVLDTSAQLKLYGGSGIGNLAGVLSGFSTSNFAAGGISPGTVSDPQALADAIAAQQLLEQAIAFFINENQQSNTASLPDNAPKQVMAKNLAALSPASGGVVNVGSSMLAFLTPNNLQGGQIIADDLTIVADDIYNTGGTITANNLGVLSAKRITNGKAILADGSLSGGDITGANLVLDASESLTNIGGKIRADGLLAINAGSLTNEALTDAAGNVLAKGRLRGNDIQLSLQDQLTTNNGSVIRADNNLMVDAKQGITNNAGAVLKSGGDMQLLTEGAFVNRGDITIGGQGVIASRSFENALAKETVTETTTSGQGYTMRRSPYNIASTTQTTSHDTIKSMGTISAGSGLAILSDTTVTNAGTLDAGEGELYVQGTVIKNKPVLGTTTSSTTEANRTNRNVVAYSLGGATKTTTSTSQQLLGGGEMLGRDVTLVASESIINRGNITAEDNVTLQAKNITNKATLLQNSSQSTENQTKGIWGGAEINKTTGQSQQTAVVPNTGLITGKNINLDASEKLTNAGGKIKATNDLNISAKTIESSSLLTETATGQDIHGEILSRGVLKAGHDLNLHATEDMVLSATRVKAGHDANVTAGRDLLLDTQILHNKTVTGVKGGTRTEESYRNVVTVVEAGHDALAAGGRDMVAVGAEITAGNHAGVSAGRDLLLLSAQDETITSVYTKKRHGLGGKSIYSSTEYDLVNRGTSITSGGNIALVSGRDTVLLGGEVDAPGRVDIHTGGELLAGVVEDVHETHELKKKTNGVLNVVGWDTFGLFGGSENTRESLDKIDSTSRVAMLTSGTELSTVSAGDTTFIGTALKGEKVNITSGGAVNLLAAADTSFEERKNTTESAMWQVQEGQGHTSTTYNMVTIDSANVAFDADNINVDVRGAATVSNQHDAGSMGNAISQVIAQANTTHTQPDVQQLVSAAATQPGMEYLNQLQTNPNVNWNEVNDAYEEWDYKVEGLSQEGAAVIAIAVTIVTAGTGTAAAVSTAAAGVATTAGASAAVAAGVGAAASGAFTALTSQAAVTLANNRGNIGQTLDDLASSDTVRNLAVAALTQGLTDMAGNALGYAGAVPAAGLATNPTGALTSASLNIGQHATQILANSTISAGVNTAINGGSFGDMWVENLKTGAVLAGASEAAGAIGDLAHTGAISKPEQLLLHGAVGCAAGAAISGNCGSGAAGAVAGEMAADWYINNHLATLDARDTALDIAQISGAVGGLLAGGDAKDIYTASNLGHNAADNNAVVLVIVAGVQACMVNPACVAAATSLAAATGAALTNAYYQMSEWSYANNVDPATYPFNSGDGSSGTKPAANPVGGSVAATGGPGLEPEEDPEEASNQYNNNDNKGNVSDRYGNDVTESERLAREVNEGYKNAQQRLTQIQEGENVPSKTFRNRGGSLPQEGSYLEYDVYSEPYAINRGTHRIVVDQKTGNAWYTPDHYKTFIQINL